MHCFIMVSSSLGDSNLTNDKQRENQGDTKQDNFHGLPQNLVVAPM